MNMFNTLAQFSRIAIGCLTFGISAVIFVTSVDAETEIITDPKPLETYAGNLEDLEGTQSRDITQGIAEGGKYPAYSNIPSLETDKDALEAKTEALDLNLEDHDYNLGDVERPTYRVPVVNF